jgi:hypothetical protein
MLLNVAFLSSGMTLVSRNASCCCAMKKGASCPLKKHCATAGASCSFGSNEAKAAAVERQAPRVVMEARFALQFTPTVQSLPSIATVSCGGALQPPDVPPPRTA